MSKQELINQMVSRKAELQEMIRVIERNPVFLIPGTIYCKNQHSEYHFYVRSDSSDSLRYLRKDEGKQIENLCSKHYLVRLKRAAEKEIEVLDCCINKLNSSKDKNGSDCADVNSVYDNLNEGIKRNVKPSILTDEGFGKAWQEEDYFSKKLRKDEKYFLTPKGDKVKSKSEYIIACMLAEAGVPYRYEALLPLNGEVGVFKYPDFTVLNKRTRKVYYWEHCGMMGDPKYMEDNFMPKIREYYNFGFLPGDKLLLTFESKGYPLDTTQVERLIDQYLV